MPSPSQITGAVAEDLVARRLERQGFVIRDRNVRFGRYELDLVAQRGELLVVVEVRARASTRFGAPHESVDAAKIRRTRSAAAQWLARERAAARLGRVRRVRIDVASVVLAEPARIDYFENVGGW